MLKTRYIILFVIFSLILFFSLLLFHLNFFFEAIFVLSSLSIILFILILKFYKFYHDSLGLLKEENIYINSTVISFLLNPKNEYLRFKVAFENLKNGNDYTDENKRESRRNTKKKLKYDKADELKELGEAVIVQLN